MTLLQDRPAESDSFSAAPHRVLRATSPTASWRFAGRLARREVRRRPGRTLLVMLLVALPVFGMTVAAITARTNDVLNDSAFGREFGNADLQVMDIGQYREVDGEIVASDSLRLFETGPDFPAGTQSFTYTETWTGIAGVAPTGLTVRPNVHFIVVDASDPMIRSAYLIERGRAASAPGEVMLSDDVADTFGVDVGDTLTLTRPELVATVVGVHAEAQWLTNSSVVVPGFDTTQIRPGSATVRTLLDLPPTTSASDIASFVSRLRIDGYDAQSAADRGWDNGSLKAQELAWGWVAGVVAFIAVGIVIASAFATSARRQLATVGQLSANGAPERLIRRTLGLQGMWTGVLGAVLGIGLGIGAMLLAQRFGLTNMFTGYAVDRLVIPPLELIVVALTALAAATIAARVPARSASRIPVLSALAGRRPVNTPPRWLVPVGLGLFGFGIFLIAAAASTSDGGNFPAAIAVLGVLGVLFGIVCSSPLIVSWVSAVGSRRGGVTRIAARSLGRSRMRSAGVLTAVATVSAIAIAGLTATESVRAVDEGYQSYDYDDSTFELWYQYDYYDGATFDQFGNVDPFFDPEPSIIPPVPDDVRTRIETILPDATWYELSAVVFDELPQVEYELAARNSPMLINPTVADDASLTLLDLSDEQLRRLDDTGVLNVSTYLQGDVAVAVDGEQVVFDAGPSLPESALIFKLPGRFQPDVLITPEFARAQGFDTQVNRVIVDNPTNFTSAELKALNSDGSTFGNDSFIGDELQEAAGNSQWGYYVNGPSFDVPWALIQLGALVAALVMVLLVVAIGLSLAATESKDERDVLHTVGASPSTLRRVAAAKAWVLTTGAAAVSIPTGYAVVRVITWVNDQTAPFPIVGAIGIAIVIPAVAWAATLVVSAIAQKARPVQVSTLTLD